jgi:hypothetical protein
MGLVPSTSHGSGAAATIIYDNTLGADTATIDTNPTSLAGYAILTGWLYARTDEAVVASSLIWRLNNDSGAVYDLEHVSGVGAAAAATVTRGGTSWLLGVAGASAAASFFSCVRFTIPNYAGTVGFKAVECTHGINDSAADNNNFSLCKHMTYRSTSAVTRISLTPNTGGSKLKAGTRLIIAGVN